MNPKKDAYGQEIFAYFSGRPAAEIVEREDGFIALSTGPGNYFADYNTWPKIQRDAIQYARSPALDIGCGAGRVALYLQDRHMKVTAIDNSPLAIRVSEMRGVHDARLLPIERIGVFKKGFFRSIIMFGNNFGLFANKKKAKILLKKLHRITTHDARIIAESNDPHNTNILAHKRYHTQNRKRGRMPGQLRLRVRFEDCCGDWFDYLLVSQKEMKSLLMGTGWKIERFIPSAGSSYCAIIGKI